VGDQQRDDRVDHVENRQLQRGQETVQVSGVRFDGPAVQRGRTLAGHARRRQGVPMPAVSVRERVHKVHPPALGPAAQRGGRTRDPSTGRPEIVEGEPGTRRGHQLPGPVESGRGQSDSHGRRSRSSRRRCRFRRGCVRRNRCRSRRRRDATERGRHGNADRAEAVQLRPLSVRHRSAGPVHQTREHTQGGQTVPVRHMSEAVQPGGSRQETLHAHAQGTRVLLEPGETRSVRQVGGRGTAASAESDAVLGRPTAAGAGRADHRVAADRRTTAAGHGPDHRR